MSNPSITTTDNADGVHDAPLEVVVSQGSNLDERMAAATFQQTPCRHPDHDIRWLRVFAQAMGHRPYLIEAIQNGQTVGLLPLAFVQSFLFGRFLVSLPYVNSAGVQTLDADIGPRLAEAAGKLADELDCQFLELRHETAVEAPCLTEQMTSKVHMRLKLPSTVQDLRAGLRSKVRSQVKKSEGQGFDVTWGREELLVDFYDLFARRMRDLGTPVYGKKLFKFVLQEFAEEAEICCVRLHGTPAASALLIHGAGLTEVPSASALARFNPLNANMFMYFQLLKRAVEREQQTFDFGRATVGSNTYRFKKQWGATEQPAVWQYYVRRGSASDMRPESGRRKLLIRAWQHLPVWLTRLIGPRIVRGIP